MKKFMVIFVTAFCISHLAWAQTTTGSMLGFRRGVATVMFAGLGGAILGLSTLSFYGDPQEHIGNIWTGLAIGVVGGGAYVFSQSSNNALVEASKPNTLAGLMPAKKPPMLYWAWNF